MGVVPEAHRQLDSVELCNSLFSDAQRSSDTIPPHTPDSKVLQSQVIIIALIDIVSFNTDTNLCAFFLRGRGHPLFLAQFLYRLKIYLKECLHVCICISKMASNVTSYTLSLVPTQRF